MPRVHVVKGARKDYPEADIKKGDTYYWWEFKVGGLRRSKTPPRPSQLTQSKLSQAYAAMEALGDTVEAATCPDGISDAARVAAEELREVAQEYEESISNMPESLQEGPTAEDMREKIDALNSCADELDQAADEVENTPPSDYSGERDTSEFDSLEDEEKETMLDELRSKVTDINLEV